MFRKLLISLALLFGAFGTISAASIQPAAATVGDCTGPLLSGNTTVPGWTTARIICDGYGQWNWLTIEVSCHHYGVNDYTYHYGNRIYSPGTSSYKCPSPQIVAAAWSTTG